MDHHFDHHDDLGGADLHHHDDPFVHHDPYPTELYQSTSEEIGADLMHHPIDLLHAEESTHYPFGDIVGDFSLGNIEETHYPHFIPGYTGPGIIGDPGQDMAYWHHQLHDHSCAVASQDFVLESFGLHIPEDILCLEAMIYGWYTDHGGTPEAYVGDLLALHGIPIERHEGATMTELADRLSHGEKIIVGINGEDIWFHGSPNDPLAYYPGIPGQQPDHAVEVVGIDNADPAHPYVILNDPGIPDGQGIAIPMDVFEHAWATSHHFLVATPPVGYHAVDSMTQAGTMLGGYYNADGTYHYDSDNTDRDPNTGAIVRRW